MNNFGKISRWGNLHASSIKEAAHANDYVKLYKLDLSVFVYFDIYDI